MLVDCACPWQSASFQSRQNISLGFLSLRIIRIKSVYFGRLQERRMARFRILVKITRQTIRSTLHIVHNQVPAEAQIQRVVFVFDMDEHTSCVHFPSLRTEAVDHRFFEPVVASSAENVILVPYRHSALDITEEL